MLIYSKFRQLLHKVWHLFSYRFRRPKIFVTQAHLSGDGSFVDIRYGLSRPDKAQGRFPVYLIDESTGQRFELMRLPKFGMIKTRHNKFRPSGILLFRNRNNILKPGSIVTLTFGPLEAKNIKVL